MTDNMIVISTREFREKQGRYLARVKNGEDIVLKSRENGSFRLVPVKKDDTLMSKEDFFEKIDRAATSIREGKGTRVHSEKELLEYLDRL
jgi:antitoxin (DNA-binding transcriptional repressor) of toxin-antitoxin stability system